MIPKVMIILGSGSDIKIAKKATDILEKLEIPYSLKIASAHRTHDLVKELVEKGTHGGIDVFIGIAGLAAHLPGSIAAYTPKPVIGVPVDVDFGGLDALYSEVQMHYPTPVATVGVNRGDNAAILAGQILAINDSRIAENISKLRKEFRQKVIDSNEEVLQDFNGDYFDSDFLEVKNIKIEEEPIDELKDVDYESEVGILVDSHVDVGIAKKVSVILDRLKISHDIEVICPVREPKKFSSYVKGMKNAKLFIGISSRSAVITGTLTSLSEKPVIGVPCKDELGYHYLLTMVNMPPGVPVATMGINKGKNAAILAGQILAISDSNVTDNLAKVRHKKSIYSDSYGNWN